MSALIVLLLCGSAHADVVIDRYKPMEPTVCPPAPVPSPYMAKNADGSYTWVEPSIFSQTINAIGCVNAELRWKERWTDLPENGGHLIERMADDQSSIDLETLKAGIDRGFDRAAH